MEVFLPLLERVKYDVGENYEEFVAKKGENAITNEEKALSWLVYDVLLL